MRWCQSQGLAQSDGQNVDCYNHEHRMRAPRQVPSLVQTGLMLTYSQYIPLTPMLGNSIFLSPHLFFLKLEYPLRVNLYLRITVYSAYFFQPRKCCQALIGFLLFLL